MTFFHGMTLFRSNDVAAVAGDGVAAFVSSLMIELDDGNSSKRKVIKGSVPHCAATSVAMIPVSCACVAIVM